MYLQRRRVAAMAVPHEDALEAIRTAEVTTQRISTAYMVA